LAAIADEGSGLIPERQKIKGLTCAVSQAFVGTLRRHCLIMGELTCALPWVAGGPLWPAPGKGVDTVITLESARKDEGYLVYDAQVLCPTLRAGAVVVMNIRCGREAADILVAMQEAGAQLRYLPLYSPDLSPLERR
jgi:hypothetical protein